MRLPLLAAALSALCLAAPAWGQAKSACPAGSVCASSPESVMDAMRKAGLEPELSTDTDNDPMIVSEASAYRFTVFFYGCKAQKNCTSLRFDSTFAKAPENNAVLGNKWNAKKRFLQAFVRDNGEFAVAYDVTTTGGLNQANFAEVLAWWNAQLDELGDFFEDEIPS